MVIRWANIDSLSCREEEAVAASPTTTDEEEEGGEEGGSRNCRFYRFRQFTVKDRCFPRFVLKVRKIFN